MPWGAIVSGGASLISGALGSRAAGKAAKQQEKMAREGIGRWDEATPLIHQKNLEEEVAGLGELERARDVGAETYEPWRAAGQGGLEQLQGLLKPGGQFSQQITAPTQGEVQLDPGFAFRLEQGQKATERSAAARGGVLSGGAAKSLERFAQGLSSEEYGNAWERAMAGKELQAKEREALYGKLWGLSEAGRETAGAVTGLRAGTAEDIANLRSRYASAYGDVEQNRLSAVSNLLTGAGSAQAAGTMGQAQTWGDTVSNIGKQVGSYLDMSKLMKMMKTQAAPAYSI